MIVYFVTNIVNGKVYVGKTTQLLSRRWNHHCHYALRRNSPYPLHRAMRKYGKESFKVEPLATTSDAEELSQLEKSYIEEFSSNSPELGYNLSAGGEGCAGYKFTKEQRDKISRGKAGKLFTIAHRTHIKEARLGKQERVEKNALKIAGNSSFRMCCNCGLYDDPTDMKAALGKIGYGKRLYHTGSSKNWATCIDVYKKKKSRVEGQSLICGNLGTRTSWRSRRR